jgi:signal transduction histidine kinase
VLAKNNIEERSEDIVRSAGDLYDPNTGDFDVSALQSAGMYFTHKGYLLTVRDSYNDIVWDARSCDMQECNMVIDTISRRMEDEYSIKGSVQQKDYPILFDGKQVGTANIETYGPFFYSGAEAEFLSQLNRLLLILGSTFIGVSILLSVLLAQSIAKPIRNAAAAARDIAAGNLTVRLDGNYKTSELNELSYSINTTAKELQEAERKQKQLTMDVSHELRTPLTCLQGNLEAIIDGVLEPSAERMESLYEETKHLSKLVEDLNLLTNIEWHAIELDKTDFDVSALITPVLESFNHAAAEKNIELVCKMPPQALVINADYNRIKQVLINIVSNAIKYTIAGSVTIGAQKHDEKGTCEITVSDTGEGIDAQDLPKIFERFYRCDKSRARNSGGSGVGRTIASAIVKAHNGSLSVESVPGKGSVFKILL